MNDLETRLKSALVRVDPPADFAGKVLARTRRTPWTTLRPWLAAAALLLVLGGTWAVKAEEQRRAREARAEAQLELALRIASHRLNEAFARANANREHS